MRKKISWSVVCLVFLTAARSQTLRSAVAATYTGLGAYSLTHADVFSFVSNQASLARINNSAAAVYGERRFLLESLNDYTAVIGLPTRYGNFGVNTNYHGFSDYNEIQLGLAFGRKLGTNVDVGVQFNYHGISIAAGYGKSSAISFEVGTILHFSDKLHGGIHAKNPLGGKFGKKGEEKLSSVYTLGLGYEASEKFYASAEIQKEEDRPVNVNAGLQYRFIPPLLVRAGMSSSTSSGWLGVGLQIRSFRLDLTAHYHPQLGITPGLLLLFDFKKPTK